MKKKLLSYALVASIVATTALSACGNTSKEASGSTSATSEASGEASNADAETDEASGFSYEAAENDGIRLISYNGSEEKILIPAEIDGQKVTEIGESCFAGSLSVKTVTIPEGITKIGDYAFESCSYLHKIYLPDSLISIGNGSFSGCAELTLVDIQNNLQSIGEGAFLFCNKLVTLELPETLTEIGEYAFGWCQSLTTIDLQKTQLTKISDRAFYHCDHVLEFRLPNSVTSIGKRAFSNCENLKSINIDDNIQTIEAYAFESCTSLEDINYPCEELIGNIFDSCYNLTSIYLTRNVKKICADAFNNTGIEMLMIPASVTEIEPGILNNSSISEIYLSEESSFVLIDGDLYAPDQTTLLGDVEPLQTDGSDSEEEYYEDGTYYEDGESSEEISDDASENAVDTSSLPSLDDVLAKYSDFSGYSILPNDEFDSWAEEYVNFNSDIVVPDEYHNIYITAYKGETYPHFVGMTSILSQDESKVNESKEMYGDDYEKMYTMMDHGLFTEMRRFRMQRDLLLFTGVYDSQLQAAAGTDYTPSLEELKACIGNTFTDPILTSTTTDPEVAVGFGSTMFIIYANKDNLDKLGCVCMDAYMHSNENEILLCKGATYKILDVGTTAITVTDENGESKTVAEDYITVELLAN